VRGDWLISQRPFQQAVNRAHGNKTARADFHRRQPPLLDQPVKLSRGIYLPLALLLQRSARGAPVRLCCRALTALSERPNGLLGVPSGLPLTTKVLRAQQYSAASCRRVAHTRCKKEIDPPAIPPQNPLTPVCAHPAPVNFLSTFLPRALSHRCGVGSADALPRRFPCNDAN
jgi:hypothetical protein